MKNTEIDEDAIFLLEQYDSSYLTDPHPLDVEDFVERFLGLSLHYDYLSNNGCIWGRMVFNDRSIPMFNPETGKAEYHDIDKNTIVIDNTLLSERMEHSFRFTVGHEGGHSIFHKQIYYENSKQLTLFGQAPASTACRSVDVSGRGTTRGIATDHDWIEHHANYFSAAILMPKPAMEIVCRDPSTMRKAKDEFPTANASPFSVVVADVFNVSPISAQIRVKQLGLNPEKKETSRQIFLFSTSDTEEEPQIRQ